MTDKLHELFLQVKIGNVMNKAVVTVYEDEDLSIAQEKFLAHTVSHILVLDRRDRLSGLISQKYLYKTYSPRKIINDNVGIDKNVILDGDSYYDKNSLNGYILRTAMKKAPFSRSFIASSTA